MKTLSVVNNKGGVGKTTTSVNLAYDLSEKGYRVLLIDCCEQGNSSQMFGRYDITKPSIADVLAGDKELKKVIRRTKYKNLDIAPGNALLSDVKKIAFGEFSLHFEICTVQDRYDYCIIDCSPSMQLSTMCALVASDYVLVPAKMGQYELDGLDTVLGKIREAQTCNPNVKLMGVVVTMFYRSKVTRMIAMDLMSKFDCPIMDTVIRRGAAVDMSTRKCKPLLKTAMRSNPCVDYLALTEEIIEKTKEAAG